MRCKKCHATIKKSHFMLHKKSCVPDGKKSLEHYIVSRSSGIKKKKCPVCKKKYRENKGHKCAD